MVNIVWFKELSNKDINIAGGKGASLGEMYNAELPIPPGFVITAQAFKEFLESHNLDRMIKKILDKLNVDNTKELQEVSKKIKELILKEEMSPTLKAEILEAYENLNVNPELLNAGGDVLDLIKNGRGAALVAVRSSATAEDLPEASFAGQQETFLNISGNNNLINAVRKCWASLYTPRAIFYREKHKFLHEKVYIAVIVQKMINAEKAGVMFTVNPTNNNEKEILIEAGFGLGEAVVSGSINPDLYIVDKEELKLKSKKIMKQKLKIIRDVQTGETVRKKIPEEEQSKQVLTNAEIEELAKLGKKIEEHYKKPQDIEFAVEKGRVYIVQSRPVTTLGKKIESKELKGEVLCEGLGASPGIGIGKVHIIRDEDKLNEFQEGEVLVTEMTNPSYVPIMRKAKAIVTNEGGSSCFEGSTKVLTNKGFMEIRDVVRRQKEGEDFFVLAYDAKKLKPRWKRIISSGSRISKIIRVCTSQKGNMGGNYLDLTPDHKMFTFKDRQLIKKQINDVLEDKESLCLIDSLPKNENIIENIIDYKLAYLSGAILADGYVRVQMHHTGNPRRGSIVLTQKDEPYRKDFIEKYKTYFRDVFGENLSTYTKTSSGYLRGRLIEGKATAYTCAKLKPAMLLTGISQNLATWCLQLDEFSGLHFLAGLIDGDGSFYNNRIQIYVSKENILQGIIITCLKLGIRPQVTSNRNIYNIQILERMEDILQYSEKIKPVPGKKLMGTKLFAAKQILGDIVDEVNWLGKVKPYVKHNLLIDAEKIKERLLDMASPENKKNLIKVLNSNLRMHRVNKLKEFGENEVFNLEVEADNELDHNFIVFTKRYTPLLVSNSHAAIVSRELGVPCIVGTENATAQLSDGLIITVDGTNGKVYKGEVAGKKEKIEILDTGEGISTKTKIYMNLGEPSMIEKYAKLNFDGIGLMRVEFIIAAEIGEHPNALIKRGEGNKYKEKLKEGIGKVARVINPRPVIVRFSDFKTNEYRDLKGGEEFEEREDNPMIGFRGVSRYISEEFKEAFKLECRAVRELRESCKNVHVMLPFVRNTKEVERCLETMKEEGLERKEGFEIWLMAEVPSMAIIPEKFAELEVDGCSIGSNDLTQLVLGVDRDSEKLGKMGYFDERNPAVFEAIKKIIYGFKKYNKTVSICGQAPSVYKEVSEFLVRQGITSISVNPDAVGKTRRLVAEIEKNIGQERS